MMKLTDSLSTGLLSFGHLGATLKYRRKVKVDRE